MNATQWESLTRGADCPLCAPRAESDDYKDLVATLSVSSLYLAKNQTYRGQCQLIFDLRHAARPDQLSQAEWTSYCDDLFAAQNAVMRSVRPDHINLETLGNMVPHLHWHIVPRYLEDPCWGRPIWTTVPAEMADFRLPAGEHAQLIAQLRDALKG